MWQENCEKVENLENQNKHKELHQAVKTMINNGKKKKKLASGCIADKARWKYFV